MPFKENLQHVKLNRRGHLVKQDLKSPCLRCQQRVFFTDISVYGFCRECHSTWLLLLSCWKDLYCASYPKFEQFRKRNLHGLLSKERTV